jgi:DNA-binding HxlR family transcriptional regulator
MRRLPMISKKKDSSTPIMEIDKLIHEPARLMIMAHLYVVESAEFLFLMRQTELTFGNLSSHLSKLEKADYVNIKKEFVGKKPHTMLELTKKGREAFLNYRKRMKRVFEELPE